jgi:putative ABC transport system substrate-binding protein
MHSVSEPDVILSESTPAAAALKQEARAIPIVFVGVSDPVGSGFVASLARPGGDLTGMMQYESGIVGKWLAMLKDVAPRLARVVFVANSKFKGYDYFWRFAQAAAPALAIELIPSPVSNDAADVERSIEAFARVPDGGLLVVLDATIIAHRDLVISLAARYRLPTVYPWSSFVTAGALMSYGVDNIDVLKKAASYVDRSCVVQSPSICRCRRRPNTKRPSTSRPPRHLGSPFRQRCSRPPTM